MVVGGDNRISGTDHVSDLRWGYFRRIENRARGRTNSIIVGDSGVVSSGELVFAGMSTVGGFHVSL